MPVILNPENMPTESSGEGWMKISLADLANTGTSAIAARRWSLKSMAAGPEQRHKDADEMLYVISGRGAIVVNGEKLLLEHETVLWLEPGDVYQLIAGEDGLEVLQGYAPGE